MADDIGFIYLAVNDTMPGLVKIGLTKGEVRERMKELSSDTGVPAPFKCAYSCKVQNLAAVEKQLHKQFGFCRESGNREFFRIDWRAVQAAIEMMSKADGVRLDEGQTADNSGRVGKFTLIKWAKEGDADKVRHVLAIGGQPDQADENNQTALIWAAKLGHLDIVNVLLDGKADPNKTDKGGRTALMLAAVGEHTDIAKVLLSCGAHANATNKGGETALDKAEKADVVKTLLDGGAKPSDSNLYRAVSSGHAEIVRMLLDSGLKLSVPDMKCALKCATEADQADIVKMLRENLMRRKPQLWAAAASNIVRSNCEK